MFELAHISEIVGYKPDIESFAFEALKLRDEVFEYGDRSMINAVDELMICIGRAAAQRQAVQQFIARDNTA
jgi:hypothetical protein